jgi:hypothetical protein
MRNNSNSREIYTENKKAAWRGEEARTMVGRILVIVMGALFLQGCASTKTVVHRYPLLNTEATCCVGEAIYKYGYTRGTVDPFSGQKTSSGSRDLELVYCGLPNGVLDVKYREFANDLAREAFYLDAGYDYAPERKQIIEFKGAKIEILSASINEIKYKVLSGFSDEGETDAK